MKDIKIFTNDDVSIDLDTLIATRCVVCANSGAGKSYLVRKFLENTHGSVLSIVLDMEGEFHTLREKYDYLLVGGKDGDVQINLESAKLLPKTLLELNVPTIIDMSDLKRHERVLYVKYFLEALMNLPKDFWKPCMIILDEAHLFCGQQELQDSTGAVIDLMTRGRKRGFCGILATQRISKLHKDAVAEANNYFVGRTSLDIDMKRSADILGFVSKSDLLSLRDLNAGEFFVFGTAISKNICKVMVARASTTHPKVGSLGSVSISPPTPKIKAILEKISSLPKKAGEELRELSDYKKRIRELEASLKSQKPAVVQPDTSRLQQKIEDRLRGEYSRQLIQFDRKYNDLLSRVSKAFLRMQDIIKSFDVAPIKSVTPKVDFQKFVSPKVVESKFEKSVSNAITGQYDSEDSNIKLKAGALRILKAVAMFDSLNRRRAKTLGLITAQSTFSDYLSKLKTYGYVVENNKLLTITDEGRVMAGTLEDIPTDVESLVALWSRFFKAGTVNMLKICVEIYPESISRSDLMNRAGITAQSTFSDYLSKLKSNGLVVEEDKNISASKDLMGDL